MVLMKKNTDKISQAYYYELGREFGEKVRNRVHWVLENATGETILDVGCSQGLVSILLAREGKNVIAIDVLEEAIQYAKNQLDNEEVSTINHIEFIHNNFMDFNPEKCFDVIIMGEFLEHISDAERFITKAKEYLNEDGKLIITVPFGVNNYFDHKRTFYLSSLLKFTEFGLAVDKVKFLGKWTGIVLKNSSVAERIDKTPLNLLKKLEDAFEAVEKEHINKILELKEELKASTNDINLAEVEIPLSTTEPNEVKLLKNEVNSLKNQLENEKKQTIITKRELIEQQMREQDTLKEMKNLRIRYDSLKNSKLGKFTMNYWNWKNRRR